MLQKITVLFVDDNPDHRELVLRGLSGRNIQVNAFDQVGASGVREALCQADLTLLNIRGYDGRAEFAKESLANGVPVAYISAAPAFLPFYEEEDAKFVHDKGDGFGDRLAKKIERAVKK